MTRTSHHAPWRAKLSEARGDISPNIYNPNQILPLKGIFGDKLRLILATCDYNFLEQYIERLSDYESCSCQIPYFVGVYSPIGQEYDLEKRLEEIKKVNNLQKVHFFIFTSSKLDWVLNQQDSEETRWDYKINFIRNARYNLVSSIWNLLSLSNEEHTINDSSIYVIDFDNKFKADINSIIKKKYGTKKILFSWNSSQSPNKNFPENLSGCHVKHDGRIATNHSYKIVKAGFTVFSPNMLSRNFLWLFKMYSIGDSASLIFIRLFTFYFSDQVAILLSLLDLKSIMPRNYTTDVAWLDINTSKVVNLDDGSAKFMWYPKGVKLKE